MKRWILCCIVFIVGTIGSVRHTAHECASAPCVTIAAHPHCTASMYRCIHNAMDYILPRTYQAHSVRNYLQYIMPHVRDVHMRWVTPRNVHLKLTLYKPCVTVTDGTTQYVVTENGACVRAHYIPRYIRNMLPHIMWHSHDDIRDYGSEIIKLYTDMPRDWWDTYIAHWYGPTDIRLYTKTKNQLNIRTTAYRTIPNIEDISYVIKRESEQNNNDAWIDIRYTGYAIAYKTIRGR